MAFVTADSMNGQDASGIGILDGDCDDKAGSRLIRIF
jgi:hypothetical protein